MNMIKSPNFLILHTGLFEETEQIKNIVQTSKKFDNSTFITISSKMQESDWDGVVAAIQLCEKVITI